jgi:hypothetical protein
VGGPGGRTAELQRAYEAARASGDVAAMTEAALGLAAGRSFGTLPGVRVADADTGPLLDRQALAAYRRRLAELDEDLAEADAWGDPLRGERLTAEREALLAQVAQATGLGGRIRGTTGTRERARVAVRKAIVAAIIRIGETDSTLGRLLRDTVITGGSCRYDPDPVRPVRWVLDGGDR